jgi:peptidyl-prolyl cis-trans isomerase B (cyclophilin B)
MKRALVRIMGVLLALILLVGCGKAGYAGSSRAQVRSDEVQFTHPTEGDTVALISTSMGDISIVLYPEYAPMAVENFIGLAQQGYYNGVSFHRVVADFAVQTGDATGTGTGGTSIWNGHSYPTELSDALHHYSGAVALACAQDGSVGNLSQFYIVQTPEDSIDKTAAKALTDAGVRQGVADAYRSAGGAPYLDGQDTVFGQVYSGMDVVDAIGAVECDENGRPLEDVTILSVTVSTYTAADITANSADSDVSASE